MSTTLDSHSPIFRVLRKLLFGLLFSLSAIHVPAQVIAGRLEVRVVDEGGKAVSDARVTISMNGRRPAIRLTSRHGVAFFANLESGLYTVEVEKFGSKPVPAQAVLVSIVETRTVYVRLPSATSFVAGEAVLAPTIEERTEL